MKTQITLLAFLFSGFVTAQSSLPSNVPDSLWKSWGMESASDSVRLEALVKYTRDVYVFNYPDTAVMYAQFIYDYSLSRNLLIYQSEGLNILGTAYTLMDDNKLGLNYFMQSLAIDRQVNDPKMIATKLNNIGIIYKNQGDYVRAAEYYAQALELSLQTGNPRVASLAYSNLGVLMMVQSLPSEAIDYIMKSMAIRLAMNDKKGLLISYVSLGEAYKRLEQPELALLYLDSALTMAYGQSNKRHESIALFHKGDCYRNMGNYSEAMIYFEKCAALDLELKDPSGYCTNMQRISDLYFINGSFDKSLEIALECYSIAMELNSLRALEAITRMCVMDYCRLHQPDSAVRYLTELNSLLIENLKRHYFTYSEDQKEEYFIHKSYLFEINHDFAWQVRDSIPEAADTALNMALLTKGLSLKSTTWLRNEILQSEDSVLIADYMSWLEFKKQIAAMSDAGQETSELEKQAAEKEKQLYKSSPSFAAFVNELRPDWRSIRDNLQTGEAAIEFVHFNSSIENVYDYTYAAYIVTPGCEHPKMVKLCSEDDLKAIVGVLSPNNLSFVNQVYGTKQEAQTALYQKIWQPLEPYLQNTKTVYYSPSGQLHKISFAAICKSQDVFLSDVYNFRQVSSTGAIEEAGDIAFGSLENFLLMGGVRYSSDSTLRETWSYLPGSLTETENIYGYLKKKKFGVNYFKENYASEEIFKEKIGSASFVHIATHGFFFPDPEDVDKEIGMAEESKTDELKFRGTSNYANWSFVNNKNPLMRSGIVLAGANDVWQRQPLAEGEDGVLTAQEVSMLDLRNTKLVVLSACETGLGDIRGSEGVFGLQRAFKMAGARYMIMSLWQVPDKETSEFMQLFYKNLLALKDIPVAFQKTQKAMREKYDPFFWGAFVLIE